MTEHEKYQEHIRHTHDAFCKTVIRHAAIDAARSIRSRRKREISLEYYFFITHKQKSAGMKCIGRKIPAILTLNTVIKL